MYGGPGNRKFYISEVKRIESWHSAQMPPGGYTPEQVEAGYEKVAKAFGFSYTLRFMEKNTPYKRAEILEWPIVNLKSMLQVIAWENYTDRQYAEIMKKK